MSRLRSSIALLVGCVWALGLGGTAALAADMSLPTKAPPPAAPPPLDIHGFVELDYSSFLINPQGQALAVQGAETLVAGLNWTLYKSKTGFINNITVGGGIALDFANSFDGYWGLYNTNGGGTAAGATPKNSSGDGVLYDSVYFVDASVTFGQYWTLSDTYYNVYSDDVCGTTACAVAAGAGMGFGWLNFNELKLSLNDSFTGWPITFNPYVTWYYEFTGWDANQMPACFSCQDNAGDFFIGMTPTLNFKAWGFPQFTLKAPTYVTVGSSSFWTNPGCCGVASSGGVGVFTTGLTGVWNLTWVPANYGNWYFKGGVQWYDIVNSALEASNQVSLCGAAGPCSNARRDIVVGFAGLGVAF